jgi:hypothetical protein
MVRSASGRCRSAPIADLVPVGIAERGLADSVRVGLSLLRDETTPGDLLDEPVEIIDEDGVHRVAGLIRALLDSTPYRGFDNPDVDTGMAAR